jgi:homoserine O-succinyltransferase
MPIRIPENLPALDVLTQENIFAMDFNRAMTQDIRPMELGILNLMPNKIETEIQLLRLLSNTPLQVNVDLIRVDHHETKITPKEHMDEFYYLWNEVKQKNYDGLIITGAPLGLLDYKDVTYWGKMTEIMDWARKHVQSTLYLCWAAHAAMYHYFGKDRVIRDTKLSGVYPHTVELEQDELVRGFDSQFNMPHSRYAEIPLADYQSVDGLNVLAHSEQAGVFLSATEDKRLVFVTGHPEYDPLTLDQEYKRDVKAGIDPTIPENYYRNNDPSQSPLVSWRAHGSLLLSNWLNYYVYQATPYDLNDLVK